MKDRDSPARNGRDRFVLRYRGSGTPSPDLGDRLKEESDVTVLDESPRMLLVEAPALLVEEIVQHRPGWTLAREAGIPAPRPPRPRVRRPAH